VSVAQVLRRWTGQAVTLVCFPGNHGDRLIELGSRAALSREGLRLTSSSRNAAAIVINGGAAVTEAYRGMEWLVSVASRYADTPLLVLPSTFQLGDPERLLSALRARSAPVTLFAREQTSLRELVTSGVDRAAEIGIDQDMAFGLRDSEFLCTLHSRALEKHLLIVERTDREEFTGRKEFWSMLEKEQPPFIRAGIPGPVRRGVRELLATVRRTAFQAGAFRVATTSFARHARELAVQDTPAFAALPVIAADISQTSLCSFDTFCRLIAEAAAVVSTRLHVAVLAALLGKPTYLAPGSITKLRSVYDYSLSQMPNVRVWDWPQRRNAASL
jgi:exopolysaccharide biosynthesis predicted pyruvyltransferase EpsI